MEGFLNYTKKLEDSSTNGSFGAQLPLMKFVSLEESHPRQTSLKFQSIVHYNLATSINSGRFLSCTKLSVYFSQMYWFLK